VSAAALWDAYQALKADPDALPVLRGKAWEAWFAQAIREGHDPSRLRRDAPTIDARIDARIVEGLDGCLIWDGSMSRYDAPQVSAPYSLGGQQINVRRWLLKRSGHDLPPNRRVSAVCGQLRCVRVDHLRVEERHWGRRSTKEELIAKLQVLALHLGHAPSQREWKASGQQMTGEGVSYYFGGWGPALVAAGLTPTVPVSRRPLTERSHCLHGHPVTPETLESNGHGTFRCRTCRQARRSGS